MHGKCNKRGADMSVSHTKFTVKRFPSKQGNNNPQDCPSINKCVCLYVTIAVPFHPPLNSGTMWNGNFGFTQI